MNLNYKKLFVIGMALALALAMATSAFALTSVNETLVDSLHNNATTHQTAGMIEIEKVITDYTLPLKEVKKPKKLKSGAINQKSVSLSGELTSESPYDYYIFSVDQDFKIHAKLNSSNSDYYMTLGVVDYESGNISLTTIQFDANEAVDIGLPGNMNLAWILQVKNGNYGNSYSLNHHIYIGDLQYFHESPDFKNYYSLVDNKLYVNGEKKNIDYKHDREFDYTPPYGEMNHYNKLHIWLQDPNVLPVGIGVASWKEGALDRVYRNVMLLKVLPGGTFSHEFRQYPPTINWRNLDGYGFETPREIREWEPCENELVYDLDNDEVIEFHSELIKPWSSIGDKKDFKFDFKQEFKWE